MSRRWTGSVLTALGLSCGALASALVAGVSGVANPHEVVAAPAAGDPFIEVTHVPVSLTLPGEPIDLRYDVYCGGPNEDVDAGACDATGSVFVRRGDSGGFEEIPLALDPSSSEGRYVAHVPDDIARSPDGFSYFATFRSVHTGRDGYRSRRRGTAPQRSLRLGQSVDVRLGTHVFRCDRRPGRSVAQASWGDGSGMRGSSGARASRRSAARRST